MSSETYHIVKEIIKREFIGHYKMEMKKRKFKVGLILGIIFTIATGVFTIAKNTVFANICFGITAVLFIFSIFQSSKPKKNDDIISPLDLVSQICLNLRSLDLYSLTVIDSLQEEILYNIKEKEAKINLLYKRISILFVSIFWVPFGFLTKYLLDGDPNPLSWENYIDISANLLGISLMLIGVLIATGGIVDSLIHFESNYLKFVNGYVNDVKYMILSGKYLSSRAEIDAIPVFKDKLSSKDEG